MKIRKSQNFLQFFNNIIIDLPAFSSLNHFWNIGSILGLCLLIQILTGVFLAIHYTSDTQIAFNSISHIIRDVNYGWLIRLLHSNGASLFFFIIYLHIGRALYFNSYQLQITWTIGITIFLFSIITAFLGYVLPWGQISYWGATVITNLLSAIPILGPFLVEWVWGGFSVNNATLTRFFSLHYLIPFFIFVLVIIHLVFLHEEKSSNPLGLLYNSDKISFHPYFSSKDSLRILFIIFFFLILNLLKPFLLIDPENFIPANSLRTPPHIQPEWYFLFAYAILRSIPNKLGGVIALLFSIILLFPLRFKKNFALKKKFFLFWNFVFLFLLLTWLGIIPVETPFLEISSWLTFLYFLSILLFFI